MMLPNAVYQVQHRWMLSLVFFLFMIGEYYLYIGFALKPYMIFLFLFLFFHLPAFKVQQLYSFEVTMILFYWYYGFTGAFSLYPAASIRILLGILLVLACYFIVRYLLMASDEAWVERGIAQAGILFNLVSLILYAAGLQALGFQTKGDMIQSLGVLVDRDYPRLTGVLTDPNLFIFYNTLFIAYYMANLTNWRNRAGLGLALLTCMLTFSRGGILAILLMLFFFILMGNPLKKWKLLAAAAGFVMAGLAFAVFVMKIDIIGILESRIHDVEKDGGSGRFDLWVRAWEFFLDHPVLGVGASNYIEYNYYYYGDKLYTHNTFLQILSESGLPGFLFYVTFLALLLYRLFKSGIYKTKPYLLLACLALIMQLMFLSLIVNEVFILYLALLTALLKKKEEADYERIAADR